MKMTLLEMDQAILSSLGSDEVNSVSDTTESLQVCEVIKQVYFNMLARSDLPMQEEFFQLDGSTDITQPVLMYRPTNVSKMEWIKYFDNSSPPDSIQYKYVTILPVRQFVDMVNSFNPTMTDTETFTFTANGKSFTFNYKINKQPQFCTVLQNFYVIFDSYDTAVDSTLQSSKTMCWGEVLPAWSLTDTFVPDIDDQQFPLLLNESKSLAFLELKQMTHAKAEQEAKRQWGTLQRDKSLTDRPTYFDQLANFGRAGPNYGSPFKQRGWDAQ
jgi:hypothetical protein